MDRLYNSKDRASLHCMAKMLLLIDVQPACKFSELIKLNM